MKNIKLLSTLLLSVFVLTSCGPSLSAPDKTPDNETATPVAPVEGEEIVLQIVDSSDSTKVRREEYNAKFMAENPGVTIQYTTLPGDQYKTTITSAIKGGSAPDLFALPSGFKLSTVIEENWYQPMNQYLEDGFLDTFADGALNDGITTLNDNVYVLPESANIVNSLMFYNKTVFKDAGLDPENPPKTWSEFIEASNTIAKAGNGKYYPIIEGGKQANRLEIAIRALSSLAGSKSNDIGIISLVDGKTTLNSEGMVSAFNFLDTLVKNGSFHPDTVNFSAPEARAMFAQGQAAFIIQGSWCISTWNQDNPELDFGVMALPVPDDGAKGGLPYIGAQPWMGLSATSKHPEMAAKYLQGLYSEDYQSKLVEDGGFVSAVKGINEKYMTNETMLDYYVLSQEAGKLAPDPIVGNPDASMVYSEVKDISPNLGQIVQGVIAGSIPDYKTTLDQLAADSQADWERAIDKVKADGVDISKDDFEFKNWDPLKDYTATEYENR